MDEPSESGAVDMVESQEARGRGSSERLSVLLADDSDAVRRRIAELLTNAGAQIVAEATNGVDAVAMARDLSPDLVVLDLHMPHMNGLDALAEIKRLHPAPVVAVVTNYTDSAYRDRCVELGADYFLDKSTEFDRLSEITAQLVPTGAAEGPG